MQPLACPKNFHYIALVLDLCVVFRWGCVQWKNVRFDLLHQVNKKQKGHVYYWRSTASLVQVTTASCLRTVVTLCFGIVD